MSLRDYHQRVSGLIFQVIFSRGWGCWRETMPWTTYDRCVPLLRKSKSTFCKNFCITSQIFVPPKIFLCYACVSPIIFCGSSRSCDIHSVNVWFSSKVSPLGAGSAFCIELMQKKHHISCFWRRPERGQRSQPCPDAVLWRFEPPKRTFPISPGLPGGWGVSSFPWTAGHICPPPPSSLSYPPRRSCLIPPPPSWPSEVNRAVAGQHDPADQLGGGYLQFWVGGWVG